MRTEDRGTAVVEFALVFSNPAGSWIGASPSSDSVVRDRLLVEAGGACWGAYRRGQDVSLLPVPAGARDRADTRLPRVVGHTLARRSCPPFAPNAVSRKLEVSQLI